MTDQLATHAHAATPAPAPAERPRIYVACLAAYNSGCLHGRWIDATTPDEIREQVRAMLADSPKPSINHTPPDGFLRYAAPRQLFGEQGV